MGEGADQGERRGISVSLQERMLFKELDASDFWKNRGKRDFFGGRECVCHAIITFYFQGDGM